MSVFELIKEFTNGFRRGLYRNFGFPVELNGSFTKFMNDIRAGDCYVALDTNILVNPNYHMFTEANQHTRFAVSEHTIRAFEGSIDQNDEFAELAMYALNTIEQATQAGYNISMVSGVSEEAINRLGFEMSFPAAVVSSFYEASIEVEQTHQDCRRLFLVTLSTEESSISMANHLSLPTYVLQNHNAHI